MAAVIDKDFAAELLAEQVDADVLMILTEVESLFSLLSLGLQKLILQINTLGTNLYFEN